MVKRILPDVLIWRLGVVSIGLATCCWPLKRRKYINTKSVIIAIKINTSVQFIYRNYN